MDMNRRVSLTALAAAIALSSAAQAQLPFLNNDPNLVRCESVDSREVTCNIPVGKMAEFVRQESQAPCTRSQTYAISARAITVTRGCRATFRLSDTPALSGSTLTNALRADLIESLARKLADDQDFRTLPTVTLVADREREISASQVGYTGTARVTRSGRFWKSVEFESVYDTRARQFTSLGYRLADNDPGDVTEHQQMLRERLDTAMEAKLDAENRDRNFNPRFELLTSDERFVSTNETAITGTGRVQIDGSGWRPVTFEGTWDGRAGRFRSLDYRRTDNNSDRGSHADRSGDRMDEDVEAALMRALAEEVRRQKGGSVQAVINRRFRSTREGGDVEYTGKFGYSWNDGKWVTRGYEAVFNPSGERVRSVRIYRVD